MPAAGIGKRMGGSVPKQYLPLIGRTVIEHTLDRLLAVSGIAGVVVALHARDQWFRSLPVSADTKIHPITGGSKRSDSVMLALNFLENKARSYDWILVHDAARCCIKTEKIDRLLHQLGEESVGGILGVPASDTLKRVNPEQKIVTTLDRQAIWQAQTPQVFRYGLLREAMRHAHYHQRSVTDEASAVELAGYGPCMIRGDYDNIKITHPGDLAIAAAILEQQNLQP